MAEKNWTIRNICKSAGNESCIRCRASFTSQERKRYNVIKIDKT